MTRGKPFAKGTSGNPGGRRAVPEDVKRALRMECSDSIGRLIALAKDTGLKADPKTLPVYYSANLKIVEWNLGKTFDPVALEEEPVTIDVSSQVPRVQPIASLPAILSRLGQLGRLPLPGGSGAAPAGADATAHEVRAAPAAPDAGGVSSPDGA